MKTLDSPPNSAEQPEKSAQTERAATVELGDFGNIDEPQVRYLMGRFPSSPFILTAHLFATIGLAASFFYSIRLKEWSPIILLIAWSLCYIWIWLYSVSYNYRRKINNIYTLTLYTIYSASLAYFFIERSTYPTVFNGEAFIPQPSFPYLAIASASAIISGGIILSHALYFGRGYRERN